MTEISAIDTSTARLPSTYNAAKRAISQCVSIDECKDWSDKAAALASYAKQAQDDQLEKMAKRIRARATRRAGELLKQIDRPETGGRPKNGEGNHTVSSAARDAGMSKHQQVQATRIANIPEDDFEEMVEANATITELASVGTVRKEPNRDASRALVAAVRAYADKLHALDTEEAISAMTQVQAAELRMLIARIDGEHDRIVTRI